MCDKANNNSKVYLSKHFVGEPHSEYIFKVDYSVIFTNEEKDIKKQIVDNDGNILDFPGVEYTDTLNDELGKRTIEPIVKYEAIFEKIDDDKFIMVWTVRPDGRYWMDSWGLEQRITNRYHFIHISTQVVILQCHLSFTV